MRLFHNGWIDSKIENSPGSLSGFLWNASGFLVQAKHAHRILNLASKMVILAEQCVPSMIIG